MTDKDVGQLIAGVDEAGRGPLAGPVVAAAVILDPTKPILGLNDSKKLTEKKREKLFEEIREKALCYSITRATATEIDQINILQATMLAMKRAVESLPQVPGLVLIDGNRCPDISIPARAIIGGDGLEDVISAASILAKVARDRLMRLYDRYYPEYGFGKHKGYGTAMHMQALKSVGPCRQHRMSFAPVRKAASAFGAPLESC